MNKAEQGIQDTQQIIDPEMEVPIVVTLQEADYLLSILAERPYKEVYVLINKIGAAMRTVIESAQRSQTTEPRVVKKGD